MTTMLMLGLRVFTEMLTAKLGIITSALTCAAMPELVSCLMATRNRRHFIPQALRCFQHQTYKAVELLVLDDGDDPVADLCKGVPRVRYVRFDKPTPAGTKMNAGVAEARGSILQKFDDDDHYC